MEQIIIDKYKQYKKEMDAAYAILKRRPSVNNTSVWTDKVKAFTDFCVNTLADLVQADPVVDNTDEILTNLDKYKSCGRCGARLVYIVDEENHNYVATSDFLEDFPGWCFPCLLEHCALQDCATCELKDQDTCSMVEIKNISMNR